MGTIAFLAIGFHLMFGGPGESLLWLGSTTATQWGFPFWLFQCVFAATTATIVSGGMAERTKFTGYLAYSVVICAFIYPVYGSWAWGRLLDGSGWLEGVLGVGFYDFAGSTVVHSIGGWIALAGALVIGPRIGKFVPEGTPKALPGHNLPFAVIGGFILWLGWFGFNPGSTTTFDGNLARIAVMTNIAGAAGGIGAITAIWASMKKPDVGMTVNGFLAGMVAICTAVDVVTPTGAFIIGLVAGMLVVFSVIFIERSLKIDDPVGCISVHGVCGAWGSLAYAFFGVEEFSMTVLFAQLIGIGVGFVWAFGTGLVLFLAIKYTIGLRVTELEMGYLQDIIRFGNQMGFGIYQSDHEDANGQYEINFGWTNALQTADRLIQFRMLAGQIAHKYGATATFMAKPFDNKTGSGAHFHLHVADALTRKNLFPAAKNSEDVKGLGLSRTAIYYIGGLLKHIGALTAISSPIINCYRRIQSGEFVYSPTSGYTWTPSFASYEDNNRTQLYRCPDNNRLEDRSPSAMDG